MHKRPIRQGMHPDPRQRLAQGWTGNRLRHRALRAPKETKERGGEEKKRGGKKKEERRKNKAGASRPQRWDTYLRWV